MTMAGHEKSAIGGISHHNHSQFFSSSVFLCCCSISTPSTSSVQSEPKSQIKKVSLEGPSLGLLVSKQEEPPKVTVESGPVEHHYEGKLGQLILFNTIFNNVLISL